jgi:phage-related protein
MPQSRRALYFVGDSLDVLKALPRPVQRGIGTALRLAQEGNKDPNTKPLKGFGGASVLEVVEDFDGNTYRAVYTVRLRSGIYVLHCFQKKSKSGIATSKRDLDLIQRRLKLALEQDKALLR